MTGNLWRATAGDAPDLPALSGDVAADVAIVGGGFTGCAAALHLAEAGADVRLLEAATIGEGGSGRNVGLVNAGLWLPPDAVERELGATAGARLNAALAAGPDLVFSLIEKHAIRCEAVRAGTLHCATSPAGLRDLEDRARHQSARGAPVRLLSAEETAARTGVGAGNDGDGSGRPVRHFGSLWDGRAGTVQPLSYVRGLARAAAAAGAVLHEGSPVSAGAYSQGCWRLTTPAGTVTARVLIRATNAYPPPVRGLPAARYVPLHYFQIATAPLGDNVRRTVLPGGEGCWDTGRVMTSFRLDAAGRLIVGALGALKGPGAAIHRAWARRALRALYPAAADAEIEHGWHGRIAMTGDHLPRVERLGPDAVGIHGYSGRGIAPGTVFGAAAARWALTGDEGAFPVAPAAPRGEVLAGLRAGLFEAGAAADHLLRAR